MILRKKWPSRLTSEVPSCPILCHDCSLGDPDAFTSPSPYRFNPTQDRPLWRWLVRRRVLSSSVLFLPKILASLAIALSSSKLKRDDASSKVVIISREESAKLKVEPRTVSSGGPGSAGFCCGAAVESGNSRTFCKMIVAADMSAMSL